MSKPFVSSPITSSGHLEPPKPFESILNWQTQNARAQNDTLLNINSKVENINVRTEQLETKVDSIAAQMQQIHHNLQSRITQLDSELRTMLAQHYYGPEFDQKEREIRRLNAELDQIESEKQRPTLFTTSPPIPSIGPTYHPFTSMLSPIRQYDPSKLFGITHTLFRDNPLPPPPKPKPKPKPQPRPVILHPSSISIPGQQSPGYTPTPAPPPVPPSPPLSQPPSQSKDKQPMHQFSAHTVDHSPTTDDQTSDSNLAVSDSHTETDTESSVSTSDSEKSYADITRILMAQPDQPPQGQISHTEPYVDIPSDIDQEMPESSATNQPPPAQAQTSPPSQKSSNGPWFTFDDLPSHKWRDRLHEMSAWIHLQMLHPGATTQSVLREFATRFTGALRDWFDSLVFEAARRDYLNMKCCSLNAKDLDFHYKRMSLLFYKLNGFNKPTLKHVFLASLPDELQPDIQRQLTASNLVLDNISLGKIFQLAKTCLDKLCEQKEFFKELLKDKEPFWSACKKPYLQIKCQKKKDCDCSPKKKRHFRKFKNLDHSSRPRRSRKPYRFFRKKSSSSRDFKQRKSNRCFICKKGHYAKDCPNKREKSIRLVEHLQAITDYSPEKDELEFYFSEQDEPNDETVFALQNSSDDSDSDQSQVIFHQQLLSLDTTVPIPSIKLQILPLKFQRPVPAIGLIDTGAQRRAHDEHHQLLTQFYDIVQNHGIMLSAKKSTIATDNIEFLDASDESWGAILLEEINGKEYFIAYASRQFSDTQKHYHSVFKEILAVKNGIKKFEYHLIGHHFLIRMDSSAFPNILNFKEKPLKMCYGYIWCLTILYATKLVLPITPTLEHLLNPDKATSLTWTLLEWFSPIPWWRKKLQHLSEIYNLERMPASEAQLFTSVFIIHRPYFQHPDTNLFWTQDQVYEWFTAPHPAVIDNEIQSNLHNYLCQLNHQTPPHKDIFHTSLGPQHDLIMIPTPSVISKPKSTGIIIKEEKPDYTDFLYQDSQDPWEEFLPLSQDLQQFPQPTMYEPGSSSQPSKVDKATQMPSPKSQSSPSKPGCRKDSPYPPSRGPHYKHPKLSKTFFPPTPCDNPYETESSLEDDYMNLRSP
ncbi:hypothetical protein KPL70_007561 [Citrus sinensis]|nr:hypothetical protein KPL70_007561 [Citrus sinensis]